MQATGKGNSLLPAKHFNAGIINFALFVANERRVGRNQYLHIPREYLPMTEKDTVLEASIVRPSAPEIEFRLYTSSGFKESHIYISPLNPSRHESFLVKSLRLYETSCFVRDFNQHKPDDFENTALLILGTKVMMRVDRSEVEIRQARLTSDGSRVILHGTLTGDTNRGCIRIAKRFEEYRLDFVDHHARITYMKGIGDKVEVTYIRSSREPYQHIRVIDAKSLWQPKEGSNPNEAQRRILELDRSNMSRKEIRAWIDTEGSIDSSPPREGGPQINVSQKHREPLEAYAGGVAELGVRCMISRDKRTGQFVARIVDYEGVAKVISEVGPFRCPQRNEQVRRFIECLDMPRKERRRVVERAKKLLGLLT
jgi:hypothetical protein